MKLQKAERQQVKLRLGISGASGFGKSYSALLLAYGITEELFSSLEMNFTIESPVFRKIDLNNTNFTELIRHPYLDKKMTVEILNLEKQIGGFLSINDLRSYSVLDEKTFEVMRHYLEVKPSK